MHLKAAEATPMANVMLTLMHKLGVEDVTTFGDSTGEFAFAYEEHVGGQGLRTGDCTWEDPSLRDRQCSREMLMRLYAFRRASRRCAAVTSVAAVSRPSGFARRRRGDARRRDSLPHAGREGAPT